MTRDINEQRAAKARSSAVAAQLSLVGTGIGALAVIAVSAQMLWQDAPGSIAPLAAPQGLATPGAGQGTAPQIIAQGGMAPRRVLPSLVPADAPAPRVWLASLTTETSPFAAHDYAGDTILPRRLPTLPSRVEPSARAAAPQPAPVTPPAAPVAAPQARTVAPQAPVVTGPVATGPATAEQPATASLVPEVRQGSPRVTPPRRPAIAAPALLPESVTAPADIATAAPAVTEPATTEPATTEPATDEPVEVATFRAPSRSPIPRARPQGIAAEATLVAAAEPQPEAEPAVATPEPGQLILASLGGEGLIRSRTPRARPEAVTRLASLDLDAAAAPSAAPRATQPQAGTLDVPPVSAALAADRCEASLTREIPRRAGRAGAGSAVIGRLTSAGGRERDDAIVAEVLAGNVPDFLRQLMPVTFTGTGPNGQRTRVTICVTPDYLAVGSDSDFVRVPLGLPAAMRVAERFDMVLPTTMMVDAIYQQASVRLSPAPMEPTSAMVTTNYFVRHNATVEGQRRQTGGRLGQLVAGHKKDLVLTNRLQSHPGQVAIYGWHQRNGRAIQPLSTVHQAQYADYSHGIRLVSRRAFVNGRAVDLRDLLSDSRLAALVSSEGVITNRQLLALAD